LPEHVQEVVIQDSHEQPSLIGSEATATRLVPMQRILSLFDPVLDVAASVVHLNHFPGRQLGIGHDKPDPWEKLSIVPLDLGDHSPLPVPGLFLITKINQLDLNADLRGPTHWTRQIGVDESVQYRIGWKPDEVRDPFTLAILVHLGLSKCRIAPKPE